MPLQDIQEISLKAVNVNLMVAPEKQGIAAKVSQPIKLGYFKGYVKRIEQLVWRTNSWKSIH